MANTQQVNVNKVVSGGCSDDKKTAWIDFPIDNETVLRIAFPVEFPPELKLALQQLQGHISEERRKAGLPDIQSSYTTTVERLEYGRDDLNQLAVIRSSFANGGSQETIIEKGQINQTIDFLKNALEAFEAQETKH